MQRVHGVDFVPLLPRGYVLHCEWWTGNGTRIDTSRDDGWVIGDVIARFKELVDAAERVLLFICRPVRLGLGPPIEWFVSNEDCLDICVARRGRWERRVFGFYDELTPDRIAAQRAKEFIAGAHAIVWLRYGPLPSLQRDGAFSNLELFMARVGLYEAVRTTAALLGDDFGYEAPIVWEESKHWST